jgi:hypothetical protein
MDVIRSWTRILLLFIPISTSNGIRCAILFYRFSIYFSSSRFPSLWAILSANFHGIFFVGWIICFFFARVCRHEKCLYTQRLTFSYSGSHVFGVKSFRACARYMCGEIWSFGKRFSLSNKVLSWTRKFGNFLVEFFTWCLCSLFTILSRKNL